LTPAAATAQAGYCLFTIAATFCPFWCISNSPSSEYCLED